MKSKNKNVILLNLLIGGTGLISEGKAFTTKFNKFHPQNPQG